VAALNDELAKRPKPKPVAGSPSQPLVLSTEEELGAVVAYLTSPGANARIPSHIDPSKPLDAQIILGFNIRSPRARTEVEELVKETWSINPVVVFGEVCIFGDSVLKNMALINRHMNILHIIVETT
jgi:hypothetical protein